MRGCGGTILADVTEVAEVQDTEATEPQDGTTEVDGAQVATPEVQNTEGELNASALREARADAAKYRKRLRALEADQQAKADADLSEGDRASKRIAELEAQAEKNHRQTRTLALESAVATRSNALGIIDAEVAVALLDVSALDFDDAGRPDPDTLDQALRRLIKAKPYLRQQVAPSSPANPARSEPVGETDTQRRSRLFGGGGGMFDPTTAARMGGGVILPKE